MASKGRNARSTVNTSDLSDTLLPALSDDPHLDRMELMFSRITKSITESFALSIDRLVGAIDEKLSVKIDSQATEIFNLHHRIDQLEKRTVDLERINQDQISKLNDLKSANEKLTLALDSADQYSRAESLIVHGIPLPTNGATENLYTSIPATLNPLIPGINLIPEMISVAHRLPSTTQSSATLAGSSSTRPLRPPPVVFRLTRRLIRSEIMAGRRHLKGTSVVITDHLTPARATLLKKANVLATNGKILSAWSQDGKILVKNLHNRTVTVLSDSDLQQFDT
jgi:hypothetical protein